ncbi:MAG: hypothetical protein C5B51_30110 [Terriglobia bacterium]|nr:MAG: hypothetical protein C5B51_30110 [Terriglobia bacterium]
MYSIRWIWLFVAFCSVEAQQREIGILAGGGWAAGLPVVGAQASASAGFQAGAAGGVLLSQDLYRHWSGEIRYMFEQRNLRIAAGGVSTAFSGQAHVVHYDLIYYLRPRKQHIRPFIAAGGGVKLFRGTGAEVAYRPLMEYAYLTRTQELKPMLTAGGGFKMQLTSRMLLRVDLRDQITRFPRKLIAPAPGMKLDGWLHDFVPTVGLDWLF